jgi:hypothetical protein
MATKTYKLRDMLDRVGDTSVWSKGAFTCLGCRKKFRAAQKFETALGSLCTTCVERELKNRSRETNIAPWAVSQFTDALSAEGNLLDRLIVLWRIDEVLRFTQAKHAAERPNLLRLLVRNLGFVQDHPLAQVVRQAAYRASKRVGAELVSLLLEMCEPRPWQFYANVVMTLGAIAPENPDVRALLQKAGRDPNPEISERAAAALTPDKPQPEKSEPDKQERLQSLLKEMDPRLRSLLQVGMPRTQTAKPAKTTPSAEAEPETETPQQKAIKAQLLDLYSADALKKIYRNYLQALFSKDNFTVKGKFSINKLKKADTAWALAKVYTSKPLFDVFYAALPPHVKEILDILVWEGGEHDVSLFEKQVQRGIIKNTSGFRYGSISQEIDDACTLFLVRREYRYYGYGAGNQYQYYFYLPDFLCTLFKEYLPPPEGYNLTPVTNIAGTDYVYAKSDQTVQQVPLFYSYIEQGNLKFSKSTGKLLKSAITQMARYCKIEEFYAENDKDLEYLKTRMVTEFCQRVPAETIETTPQFLKQVFTTFLKKTGYKSYKLYELLWHLQGLQHLRGGYNEQSHERNEKQVRKTLRKLLRALPVGEWLTVENLLQYCLYRDLDLDIVTRSTANSYLFFNSSSTRKYARYERNMVTPGLYKDALLAPFFKAVMFLFAALGIVDLAYDRPQNLLLQQQGKDYLSVFDGLRYVRLTELGAYIIGLRRTYAVEAAQESANILLDEHRLIITIEGRDRLKKLVVEKIAEQISENCYRVNYQTFLKECRSQRDIQKKVELFYEQIASQPPPIWQDFVADVEGKINPLVAKERMTVYKLKQNPDLIKLIAQDDVLKQYLLKAEDYHIVIAAKHVNKVKKRLEEFGYFIDNI